MIGALDHGRPSAKGQSAIHWLRRLIRNDQLILSLLAIVVGGATACTVVLFRESISAIQFLTHGSSDEAIFLDPASISGWRVVLALTAGGLAVGLLVHFFMPGRRNHGVADVVESCALRAGRMSLKTGFASAVVGALSIGVGASAGREGPAVHIGGTHWRLDRPQTSPDPGSVADPARLRRGLGRGRLVQPAHCRGAVRQRGRGRPLWTQRFRAHCHRQRHRGR